MPMIMGTWEAEVGTRLEDRIWVTLGREREKTKEQNCFILSMEVLNKQLTTRKQNQNS